MPKNTGVTMRPFALPMKVEPSDDPRNDSGVTSGSSDCLSPLSNRSYSPAYQQYQKYMSWVSSYSASQNQTSASLPTSQNRASPSLPTSQNRTSCFFPTSQNGTSPSLPTSQNRTSPSLPTSQNRSSPSLPTSQNRPSPSLPTSQNRTSRSFPTSRKGKSPSVYTATGEPPVPTNGVPRKSKARVKSHGKLKAYYCRHCGLKSDNKEDHWRHIRIHIDKNKILMCEECPFATHLKHHFEFHVLSFHSGEKPFKCLCCDYACVNKSMLNSHLKSHSNDYPYQCGSCTYATKYLHTLKTHLKKLKHVQGIILNADGTPNPYPIDVYGTRRGPKQKKAKLIGHTQKQKQLPGQVKMFEQSPVMPSFNAPFGQSNPAPFPFSPEQVYRVQELLMLNLLNQHAALNHHQRLNPQQANLQPANPQQANLQPANPQPANLIPANLQPPNPQQAILQPANHQRANCNKYDRKDENGVLDLSYRYSKASLVNNNNDDDDMTMVFDTVEVVQNADSFREEKMESNNNTEWNGPVFTCPHCNIDFKGKLGEFMYRIHMGQHGFQKPFTCNTCGEDCENVVSFTMHISKGAH